MKGKLFGKTRSSIIRTSVRLGVLLALLLFAAPYIPADDDHGHDNDNAADPVGTWITSATLKIIPPGFPADGKFDAVETFNSDGTMFVVSQIPGVTIGVGVWKSTGRGRFTFTFTFYRPDPSSPQKLLAVVVNENGKMIDDNHYQTTDTIEPLDASGNPLLLCGGVCAFPGTVTAKRYPFATFNTVFP